MREMFLEKYSFMSNSYFPYLLLGCVVLALIIAFIILKKKRSRQEKNKGN